MAILGSNLGISQHLKVNDTTTLDNLLGQIILKLNIGLSYYSKISLLAHTPQK